MNRMWEPEFEDWSEDKVSMSSCEIATHSSSRSEYGVMVQVEENEDDYPVNAAIFWIDEMHLYLRYNWGMWYKISNADPDNCSHICKRNSATLHLYTNSSITNHAIKVYHIDRLPEELFGKQEGKASSSPKATQLDFNLPMPTIDAEAPVEATKEAKLPDDAFLAAAITALGGHTVAHFDREPYRSDFYELKGHFIAASYFGRSGDWMADEDSDDGDTPTWFGSKEIAMSPLAIATKIRTVIAPIIGSEIPFHSMIMINPKCNIMNEICHSVCWKDTDIRLVRQKSICDSLLETADDVLEEFTGDNRPELAKYAPMIQDALNSVVTSPSNK